MIVTFNDYKIYYFFISLFHLSSIIFYSLQIMYALCKLKAELYYMVMIIIH